MRERERGGGKREVHVIIGIPILSHMHTITPTNKDTIVISFEVHSLKTSNV